MGLTVAGEESNSNRKERQQSDSEKVSNAGQKNLESCTDYADVTTSSLMILELLQLIHWLIAGELISDYLNNQ